MSEPNAPDTPTNPDNTDPGTPDPATELTVTIPENTADLSIDDLTGLATEAQTAATAALEAGDLDLAEQYADVFTGLTGTIETRVADETAAAERKAALEASLSTSIPTPPETPLAADAQLAAVNGDTAVTDAAPDPVPAPAPTGQVPAAAALAASNRLTGQNPANPARDGQPTSGSKWTAIEHAAMSGKVTVGHQFGSLREIAETVNAVHQRATSLTGQNGTYKVAQLTPDRTGRLSLERTDTDGHNTDKIRTVQAQAVALAEARMAARAAGDDVGAVVASGGCCGRTVWHDGFDNIAEPNTDFIDGFPTVEGNCKIQYPVYTEPDFSAVSSVTCAEDAAGYEPDGPTPRKGVTVFECAGTGDCEVEESYRRYQIGNMAARCSDVEVERFLEKGAAYFSCYQTNQFLDYMADCAGTPIDCAPGCADLGFDRQLNRILAPLADRLRAKYKYSGPVTIAGPEWAMTAAEVSSLAGDRDTAQVALNEGIDLMTWQHGVAPSDVPEQALSDEITCDYPDVVDMFMYVPGTFMALDGGDLEVGPYRDSTLNSQNDFGLDYFRWLSLCKIGPEVVRFRIPVCTSGAAPARVAGCCA